MYGLSRSLKHCTLCHGCVFDFHAKASEMGSLLAIERAETGFEQAGLFLEGVFQRISTSVGEVYKGLSTVVRIGTSVDEALLFEALDRGCNGSAGEMNPVA